MAIYKLGELFNFQQGTQVPISKRRREGAEIDSYITIQFLKGRDEDRYFIPDAKQSVRVSEDELLIVRTGLTGRPLMGVTGVFHNNFFKVAPLTSDKVLMKYFYYWSIKNEKRVFDAANGSTIRDISHKVYGSLKINLPSEKNQQKIIDIIEPVKKLFLKFNKCVRIDSFENARSDIQELIDIIEPTNIALGNIENQIKSIKRILVNRYKSLDEERILLSSITELHMSKFENQSLYAATNVFSEMELDQSKIVKLNTKKPSRANLTPIDKSFIFSKLKGENKVFYFDKVPEYVTSTGFFNISTKNTDHLSGYLLSNDFKNQKVSKSSGTTMQAINKNNLMTFTIKKTNSESSTLTALLSKLISIKQKMNDIKTEQIRILTK